MAEFKNYKQIILARKDLNMSPGKLAAQVSHGSMAFLTSQIRARAELGRGSYISKLYFDIDLFEEWIDGAFTKCILRARNKANLLKAKTMAEELGMKEGVDFFLIRDNCLTELTPEEEDGRTLTCIGFKPMPAEVIDQIGKKYHLYV